ncbi:MAG: hypothetical protein PF518_18110 [Spirochaetaceae bacterium]|jgi:hypothetical protein|nr:hypothetical protein [Spirochaetaceae bacterium]
MVKTKVGNILTILIFFILFSASTCKSGATVWTLFVYDVDTGEPLEGVNVRFISDRLVGGYYDRKTDSSGKSYYDSNGEYFFDIEALSSFIGYMDQSVVIHADETESVFLERIP